MRNCFLIFPDPEAPHKCGIADLTNLGEMVPGTMTITRINIPPAYRGQGFGTKLLQQILDEADQEKIKLTLEILSSGPLDYAALEAWYLRNQFNESFYPGTYIRYPQGR